MKTLLLLLAALSGFCSRHRPNCPPLAFFVHPYMPDEYFTLHQLNGHWWQNATEVERKIYLLAWRDVTGDKINPAIGIYRREGLDLNFPVKDMLKITDRRPHTF
jgi:hypothetical protein